jgi:hypothetical protein
VIAASPEILLVRNATRDATVATRVEWAGDSESRRRGLLGRESLGPEEGMYIVPCQWIHMFGMKFPIDVAFLSRSGRVLALHRGLRPGRLSRPVLRAEGVLELAAGTLDRTGTSVGDVLELLPA